MSSIHANSMPAPSASPTAPPRRQPRMRSELVSGGGGIRTLVRGLTPETVFETAAFNHSATPPRAGILVLEPDPARAQPADGFLAPVIAPGIVATARRCPSDGTSETARETAAHAHRLRPRPARGSATASTATSNPTGRGGGATRG